MFIIFFSKIFISAVKKTLGTIAFCSAVVVVLSFNDHVKVLNNPIIVREPIYRNIVACDINPAKFINISSLYTNIAGYNALNIKNGVIDL